MSTYVRLVDTKRLGIPRHVSSPRGEKKKKKRYSDRAVRPCSFLLDVIFLGFFYIKNHKVLAYLALALRTESNLDLKKNSLISRSTHVAP